jgi:CRP-like cAMP-binding protein
MASASLLSAFATSARALTFAKGARLVRQGESARGAFVLRSGRAQAEVALPGGGMLTVAEFGEGDVFGEMALVERGVCSATVTASTEVEASFIEREDFRALVASRDAAALHAQRAITTALAAKLRTLNDKVRRHPAAEDRPAREEPVVDLSKASAPSFEWRAFLPLLRFFEGFDRQQIDELVAIARAVELARGTWIFAAGQEATSSFLVVRGAVEVLSRSGRLERRVAIAGPGELVGYLAALDGASHAAAARVREQATLLEFPAARLAALYGGRSSTSVRLQHAIHASLLRSLARTNNLLTRLISHARLSEASRAAADLETALHGQLFRPTHNVNSS